MTTRAAYRQTRFADAMAKRAARNQFSIERLNDSGRFETLTFIRGERVRVGGWTGSNMGCVITGISHARQEFNISDNCWIPFGSAYKIEPPVALKPRVVR